MFIIEYENEITRRFGVSKSKDAVSWGFVGSKPCSGRFFCIFKLLFFLNRGIWVFVMKKNNSFYLKGWSLISKKNALDFTFLFIGGENTVWYIKILEYFLHSKLYMNKIFFKIWTCVIETDRMKSLCGQCKWSFLVFAVCTISKHADSI